MVNNFCTLFDSGYLVRGLALFHSLKSKCHSFVLYVYCFDDDAYKILRDMDLPGLVAVRLAEFETPELLGVKSGRTRGEYCWTCTSHVIRDCLARFDLGHVTYLDADLFFFDDPSKIADEFAHSGGAVLITEHRYTPRYDMSSTSGLYCVQYMTFVSSHRGMAALNWWCDRTIEWCFNRHEDGKFGDQKYLDDWTSRFEGVHVLRNLGGGVAPWNVQQYKIEKGPAVNGEPIIFYHFHNLAWCTNDSFMLDRYRLNKSALELIYRPYISALRLHMQSVRQYCPGFSKGQLPPPVIKTRFWKRLENRLKGKFHVIQ